jgi:hypothetical protein
MWATINTLTSKFYAGLKKNRHYSEFVSQPNKKPIVSLLRKAAKEANKDQQRLVKSVKRIRNSISRMP